MSIVNHHLDLGDLTWDFCWLQVHEVRQGSRETRETQGRPVFGGEMG